MRIGVMLDLGDGVRIFVAFEHICWIRLKMVSGSQDTALIRYRDGSVQEITEAAAIVELAARFREYLYHEKPIPVSKEK